MNSKPYDLVVVVRVCTQCALRCRFCGFSRDVKTTRREIDLDKLLQLGESLSELQRSSKKRILVSWLGGEPFDWHHWEQTSVYFHKELGLDLSVTTNGLALAHPRIRTFALHHFRQITISLDGLATSHDLLRQSPGLFERLSETLTCLVRERSKGTLIRVNSVLTRSNITHFEPFCDLLARLGIDEITFNPLGGNDRPEFYPENRITSEQAIAFRERFPRLRSNLAKQNVLLCGNASYLNRICATAAEEKIHIDDCDPGQRFLFVDELANVSPCSFTSNTLGIPIDEACQAIGDNSIEQLFAKRRANSLPSSCLDCHATHVHSKFEKGTTKHKSSAPPPKLVSLERKLKESRIR